MDMRGRSAEGVVSARSGSAAEADDDRGTGRDARLLRPRDTCWRLEPANRVRLLIDNEDYFRVVKQTLLRARRSVLLLGWSFNPHTRLDPPEARGRGDDPATIGALLIDIGRRNPDLQVNVLSWDMPLPMSLPYMLYPRRAKYRFRGSPVDFRLARAAPGACLHQKLLVVDDRVAFCSGGDFVPNRWDSQAHPDGDARQRLPSGLRSPPRHEVSIMVEGPIAHAVGSIVRDRWQKATGEDAPAYASPHEDGPWPPEVRATFRDVGIGIARTEPDVPAWEASRLHFETIAAARDYLYLENQYFASPEVGEALATRLAEPAGPEIVLVCTLHAPSYFDRFVMDHSRDDLVTRLRSHDRFGRLRVYSPRTASGRSIIVHSKVSIADDRLLRVGSTNLNNRSLGLDTECDLALEAGNGPAGAELRRTIRSIRDHLIGHFLGCEPGRVAEETARAGSIVRAIDAIDPDGSRLAPIPPPRGGPIGRLMARYQLGNPYGQSDVFRPWRRRRRKPALLKHVAPE
jgi:phosphatidylserine/phosphatidylglycerophosphate/cardiolipin synthase-like enzyme